jgi:hypothetical protein
MPKQNPEHPDPELIDEENPEWTAEDFARAVPFSGLPKELQELLLQPKHISPDLKAKTTSKPAA